MIHRAPKLGTRRNKIEHDHQTAFFSWLRLNEKKHGELKRFFAIPNGGARDHGTAIALFLEGVRPGVLDTHLPLPRHGKAGLWIEFKTETNDLSADQREWKTALEAEGHVVHVVRQWTEAARLTVEYLGLDGVAIPQ
jgi:hypothetical protein